MKRNLKGKVFTKVFVILSLVLVFSCTAFCKTSAQSNVTLFGDGTKDVPYIITSAEDFLVAASLVKTDNQTYGTAYYKLMANIDFTNVPFSPIGQKDAPFNGNFDGNGYRISGVTLPDLYYIGIIGYMNYGSVKNLYVDYSDQQANIKQGYVFGGVVGYVETTQIDKTASVYNCRVDGNVSINTQGSVNGGSFVGKLYARNSNIYVYDCVSLMDLNAVAISNSYVGGAAGHVRASSGRDFIFKNCVTYGDVSVNISGFNSYAGGFVGQVLRNEGGWSDEIVTQRDEGITSFVGCVSFGNVTADAKGLCMAGAFAATTAENVEATSCFVSSQSKVVGDEVVKFASVVDKAKLLTEDFYRNTLKYDFKYKWYFSKDDKKVLSRGACKSFGAPVTQSKVALSAGDKVGISFSATVDESVREYCSEYGFVIARVVNLGTEDLNHNFTGVFVEGICYSQGLVDESISIVDGKVTFAVSLQDIPSEYEKEVFVARPYLKYTYDGKVAYLYGDTVEASLFTAA